MRTSPLVPTLCVGMPTGINEGEEFKRGMGYHAERGN
ncbi:MAG: hypothetical protein ACI909_000741, partial [Planctomycetota bacterium]